LGKEEAEATKRALGWPLDKPFWVPDEVRALWQRRAQELAGVHAAWRRHEAEWTRSNPPLANEYHALRERAAPAHLLAGLVAAAPKQTDATRSLAGTVMQRAAQLVPSLVGGDADLGGSTKTPIKDSPKVMHGAFEGKNLRFGIREHAMGAMANG